MKVSIIIPVYNGESYLEKCLDTIINQSYKNLEIIVVNDGSKDNTLNILKNYSKKDKRIIIIDKKNEGQAIARNIALEKATGDYVTFIDSDDYVDLNFVKEFIDLAIKEDYDVAVCNQTLVNEKYEQICIDNCIKVSNKKLNFILTQAGPLAKMFKSSFLKKIGFKFLEKHIYEDLAIIPYVGVKATKVSYLKDGLYTYLVRMGSTMNQTKFNYKLNDIFNSLENLTDLFKGKYSEELEYIYIKHLLHDASLRFLKFNNKEAKASLEKIVDIIKSRYPNWKNNKYLNLFTQKELILTKLFYHRLYFIYKIYRKVFN